MENNEKVNVDVVISSTKYRPSLLGAILTIVIGLIFTFQSGMAIESVVMFIGGLLILLGATYIISNYNVKRHNPQIKLMPPINGYVSAVFGLILILFPAYFVALFMITLGVVLLALGVMQLFMVHRAKLAGVLSNSYFYIVPSFLTLLGVLIIFNPFSFANAIVIILFGVSSLIYGVSNLIRYFVVVKSEPKEAEVVE